MRWTQVLTVVLFAATLTACVGVQWKCEVGGQVGQKEEKKVAGAGASGDVIEASVTGSLFADSTLAALGRMSGAGAALDSSSIVMDVSGSNVQWPQTGTLALTIRKRSNHSVLAAKSFGWTRNGSNILLSNPVAVDAWLASSGADAAGYQVDYAFQNLTMPAIEGSNLVAVDVYQDGVPKATAAVTIPYAGGGGGCPEHTTCNPR
jgi:hypothetical protein